jgi:hypothetical protein
MKTVMKTFMVGGNPRNIRARRTSPFGHEIRAPILFAGVGVHDAHDEGLMITPPSKSRGAAWYQQAQARRRRSALGWCRATIGPQWSLRNTARPRRSPARRRRGRPLCPRSAHGRPLTAAAGARNRAYANDDGKGGAASSPPAINRQRRGPGVSFGVNQGTGKTPTCGVHGTHHEGLTIRMAR